MANAKALDSTFERCPQCDDYFRAVPGEDYVEVANYTVERYDTTKFCSIECLEDYYNQ